MKKTVSIEEYLKTDHPTDGEKKRIKKFLKELNDFGEKKETEDEVRETRQV